MKQDGIQQCDVSVQQINADLNKQAHTAVLKCHLSYKFLQRGIQVIAKLGAQNVSTKQEKVLLYSIKTSGLETEKS